MRVVVYKLVATYVQLPPHMVSPKAAACDHLIQCLDRGRRPSIWDLHSNCCTLKRTLDCSPAHVPHTLRTTYLVCQVLAALTGLLIPQELLQAAKPDLLSCLVCPQHVVVLCGWQALATGQLMCRYSLQC